MALPVSVGECLDLVERGVKLYKKVKHGVPDLVTEAGDRMESLQLYLNRLQAFCRSGNVLLNLRPAEKDGLENIMIKTKDDVSRLLKILEKWDSKEGPGGLEFRFKFVAQTLFALGSSPKELEDLGTKLDQRRDDIRDWMGLLLLWGQAEMLSTSKAIGRSPKSELRSDYNIIFIDPYNEGRSVVAEAYARLCREWTVRTGGQWRINLIHSAGLYVKSQSDVFHLQQTIGMTMFTGNKSPNQIAISTLFDGLKFNHSYKDDIRRVTLQRRSRGLPEDLFARYDFVIVFNRHNLADLENLRDALAEKREQAAPLKKGKLVLLGEYGTTGSKEIFNARKGPEGHENIQNWATTISLVQMSFRGFLESELGWIQPAPGAYQKA